MFNLANLDIGKTIIALLIVCIAGLGGYVYVLKTEIKLINSNHKVLEVKYGALNKLIEANKTEYEKNLDFAEKEQEKMRNGYEAKIKKLENWRVKNEKINCTDSLDYINNYTF